MYAVRQAIAKAIVAYYQKFVDEQSKELKDALLRDRRAPRRGSPHGAQVGGMAPRFQKSYR